MKNLLHLKTKKLLTLFAAIAFSGNTHAISSQLLFSEDFEDVTRNNPNNLLLQNTAQSVANILANNPNQLNGSPITSFSNSGNGDAAISSFNVRRGDNPINGNSDGFDGFFGNSTNQFLVIGDDAGDLGGGANGGSDPNSSSTMNLKFMLSSVTLNDPKFLDISFDYAFDSNNQNNRDDFSVEFVVEGLNNTRTRQLLKLNRPADNSGDRFFTTIAYIPLMSRANTVSYLNFNLIEYESRGSSALGIDNINVTARIPEPGILSLLGISLLSLGMARSHKA